MGGNDTLISSSLQIGVNGITSGSSANRGGGTLRLGSTNLIRSDSIIVGSGKATLTTTTANGGGYGVCLALITSVQTRARSAVPSVPPTVFSMASALGFWPAWR